jgi:EKC/KEOPS complex subunit CGI121/TPRKB
LTASIEGEQVDFTDEELKKMTDVARVKKVYKWNVGNGGGGKKVVSNGDNGVRPDEGKELEIWVLGTMALRGATN